MTAESIRRNCVSQLTLTQLTALLAVERLVEDCGGHVALALIRADLALRGYDASDIHKAIAASMQLDRLVATEDVDTGVIEIHSARGIGEWLGL